MRASHIASALAAMLRLFSFSFLAPIVVAFVYEVRDFEILGVLVPENAIPFAIGFLALNGIVLPVKWATRSAEEEDMSEREGYLTAALGWLLMPLFGMVPFLVAGTFLSPLDAYFEAMSGVTTTGFTVLPVVDGVAPSILFWRAILQWVGGIGIVVISLALISRLTHGGARLFAAEASVHASKRLRPKLVDTARTLLALYGVLSAFVFVLLLAAMARIGLSPKEAVFESLVHMMSSLATGGFSSHGASAGYFDDVFVDVILIVAMLIGATNFQVLMAFRRGEWRQGARDAEFRFWLACLAIAVAVVVAGLVLSGEALGFSLRHGIFATVSLFTATGLSTVDYSGWPLAVLFVLLLLMLMGSSSGSTAGAIKAFRIMLLAKLLQRQLQKLIHPRAVIPIRVGARVVPEEAVSTASAFIFTYVLLWLAGAIGLSISEPNLDALEVVAGSAASIGNVGNAFGALGPLGDVSALAPATKAIMATLMWFGRLEIFTALLLFAPSSWRN